MMKITNRLTACEYRLLSGLRDVGRAYISASEYGEVQSLCQRGFGVSWHIAGFPVWRITEAGIKALEQAASDPEPDDEVSR